MKHCLTMVLFLLLSSAVIGQVKTVSGTVTDDSGGGFPGVMIMIKGSEKGATSDDTGKYKIEVPNEDAVLVFSFTGMDSQEKPVKGLTTIDVMLGEGQLMEALDGFRCSEGSSQGEGIVGSLLRFDLLDIRDSLWHRKCNGPLKMSRKRSRTESFER